MNLQLSEITECEIVMRLCVGRNKLDVSVGEGENLQEFSWELNPGPSEH